MSYRAHPAPAPLLFGYDPVRDLHPNHLAYLVDKVVEESITLLYKPNRPGQPAFDPRLCAKVLIYGYATGMRSSRQLERLCQESLPFLLLTRGDTVSYRTLCSFRVQQADTIKEIWVGLFAVAKEAGLTRLGRIVIDSSKIRADSSPEAVIKECEYDTVIEELSKILEEAESTDTKEDQEPAATTLLSKKVDVDQMREILRRVRKQISKSKSSKPSNETVSQVEEPSELGPRMIPRVIQAIQTLEEAKEEGRKHTCLTDPDARMMGEGREKRVRECHSFEVVVDNELLVVGQTCQSAVDNPRLVPLIEAAKKQEPDGITAVDTDSGYYSGDTIADLSEQGLDICIPTPHTACDLHKHQPVGTTREKVVGSVAFTYDEVSNSYTCPEGNTLAYQHTVPNKGQQMRVYKAQNSCADCPLRAACGCRPKSAYRTISIGINHEILQAIQDRFNDPEHVERYNQRGNAVETVFGFLRSVLGFNRWSVRGKKRVAAEAELFNAALQFRKVHTHLMKVRLASLKQAA